jgi:hypothetical protein
MHRYSIACSKWAAETKAAQAGLIINLKKDNMKKESMHYVETEISEYIRSQFLLDNIANKRSVFGCTIDLCRGTLASVDIVSFIQNKLSRPLVSTVLGSRVTVIVDDDNIIMVHIKTSSASIEIEVSGNKDIVNMLEDALFESYESIPSSVEWITSVDMMSVVIPLVRPRGITDQSYPFITEGINSFVSRYLNGPENVLLLIGPPGTGKTNLIKHIVSESKRGAMVTYDPAIMNKDGIFANFAESEAGTLIFEDADNLLGARSKGNDMMVKFLNTSDGLVSSPDKKIIFSTNLENLDDVDPALTRRGRCAGVIKFRALNPTEVQAFLSVHAEIEWKPKDKVHYTLAEIYNNNDANRDLGKQRVGFY